MAESRIGIDGISLSHPTKVLFPEDRITKLDLAKYYQAVAPWILKELKNRPVSLVRCPAGRGKKCFFQKHPDPAMAAELKNLSIKEKAKDKSGEASYLSISNAKDLLYLVQMNVLEIHCWGCRAPKIERPDRMIFDLDPDSAVKIRTVIDSAKEMREFLKSVGLESFVKTSGGKGLHVVVPLKGGSNWDDVHSVSHALATTFAQRNSKLYIATSSLKLRKGKIFIDYLRNTRGATSIANYSTRARESASISVPLDWKELDTLKSFSGYNIKNIFQRLDAKKFKDPWADIDEKRQSLPKLS